MRRERGDRGAVTAELALALPALIAVLGVALWAITAAGVAMSAADAARAAARAAARGDSPAQVRAVVERTGPPGAQVTTSTGAGLVTVVVRARVRPSGPLPLPGFVVTGRAVAQLEAAATEVAQSEVAPSGGPP